MLRFANYNIVFQEVPDEVSLAINITGCPNNCKGCHSPHLMDDTGELLNTGTVSVLLNKYGHSITCVCFMGGDSEPDAVEQLSLYVKGITARRIKTAWYSGKNKLPENCSIESFDYVKLGSYIKESGGLDSPRTNQRFYKIENGVMVDYTWCFLKKKKLLNSWDEPERYSGRKIVSHSGTVTV